MVIWTSSNSHYPVMLACSFHGYFVTSGVLLMWI